MAALQEQEGTSVICSPSAESLQQDDTKDTDSFHENDENKAAKAHRREVIENGGPKASKAISAGKNN